MFDRLVADGDRTTTGGEVIGRSDFYNEAGKMYARKENHATCGNCKGGWPIYGTAGTWMDNGQPYVKDMDRVLCPCGKNFVLASSGSNTFYSESKGEAKTEKPVAPTRAGTYDEQFTLRDVKGSPLADTYYTVRMPSGELVHGITDSQGRTRRYPTDNAQRVVIYLGHREIVE
ncbi:PAAR domain-containing protein [Paraburkholderia oxyphila]|uniref:PAAR domain-containing protein n=1 Tax=Paraburkholderia oxyphila TaxID=614212 RepID=UPI000693B425|nr:PAAR domain-containing protein [Paraburkholderia oxyphila]